MKKVQLTRSSSTAIESGLSRPWSYYGVEGVWPLFADFLYSSMAVFNRPETNPVPMVSQYTYESLVELFSSFFESLICGD